jgi:4-hydroxyphenylpyruvate dioxygenase
VPSIAALALRMRNAAAGYRRALEHGAWAVPVNVEPMELHIPAIHGVGTSRIYFVDRWREFSIYDVDFVPIPSVDPRPAPLAGLRWFGIVQYVGNDRIEDWTDFYRELFGFEPVSPEQTFGILPKGRVLASPCGSFHLQLIEPEPGILDVDGDELFTRLAFGTPDVLAAVAALRERGVEFHETERLHTETRGALTKPMLNGVSFELVHVKE